MATTVSLEAANFYDRLGLAPSATTDDVKRAYRALLRQYPPERAPEEFKRLREAYETLGNPRSREEYDRRPDPIVETWLETGLQAMKAEEHEVAERYFKQVLLRQPDLLYVRNLLGLCFLYQGDPEKAAAQFERLLPTPDAAAAWFGNAGHAYFRLGRHSDAAKAFAEAIRRASASSDDSLVDYIVGLADVHLEQHEFAQAVKLLEDAINADGVVDFQDLRYLTKLLEVRVRAREPAEVEQVLDRMKGIGADEEQRRNLARKIGLIGQQLISAHGFQYAIAVAEAARELQPNEPDYAALEEIATLLQQKDLAGAEQLLGSHASFQGNGRLHGLGERVRRYIAEDRAFGRMKPISSAPTLYTINGIGTTIYGERDHDAVTGSCIATLYFVVFFIPIFPIACYRVTPQGGRRWSFLGKVPFSKREKNHWIACAAVLLIMFLWNGSSSSGATGVGTPEPTAPTATAAVPGLSDSSTVGHGSSEIQPSSNSYSISPAASDESWYAPERAHLRSMESNLEITDAELASGKQELESLEQQIRAIEGGYGVYSTSDNQYDNLIRQHNSQVESYNDLLSRRQSLYQEYKAALSSFNARVDAHNAHLSR